MLQSSIDNQFEILFRLISDIPERIKGYFHELETNANNEARRIAQNDLDIYNSEYSNIYKAIGIDDEEIMIQFFQNAMTQLVCSITENILIDILAGYKTRNKVGYFESKNNTNESKKQNKILKRYELINNYFELDLPPADSIWKNGDHFINKRNNIAHGIVRNLKCRKEPWAHFNNHSISEIELKDNIEQLHLMISNITKAIDERFIKKEIEYNIDKSCTPL